MLLYLTKRTEKRIQRDEWVCNPARCVSEYHLEKKAVNHKSLSEPLGLRIGVLRHVAVCVFVGACVVARLNGEAGLRLIRDQHLDMDPGNC